MPAAARASLIEHDLELQGKLLQRWGFDGPAYAEALDAIGDPAGTRGAATRLARLWGEFDATAAMAWAQRQNDGETQRAAMAATMDGWATADAWGASEWLARQAAGPDRDIAAEQLAHSIRQDEPEAAWKWAATIADPTGRARAMESVLESWSKTDASEARSALENAGSVDEATLSRLRQILSSAEPPANPSR